MKIIGLRALGFIFIVATFAALSCVVVSRDRRVSANATAMSAPESLPILRSKDGHILVKATVEGRPVFLMVDTGAAGRLYLDSVFVEECGIGLTGGTVVSHAVGGSRIESGETHPVSLRLGGVDYVVGAVELELGTLTTVSGVTIRPSGIIGGAFLLENRALIDYAAMRLSVPSPESRPV